MIPCNRLPLMRKIATDWASAICAAKNSFSLLIVSFMMVVSCECRISSIRMRSLAYSDGTWIGERAKKWGACPIRLGGLPCDAVANLCARKDAQTRAVCASMPPRERSSRVRVDSQQMSVGAPGPSLQRRQLPPMHTERPLSWASLSRDGDPLGEADPNTATILTAPRVHGRCGLEVSMPRVSCVERLHERPKNTG
jgi:hypothetical protein